MKMTATTLIAVIAALALPLGATHAQHHRADQGAALEARKQGRLLPLREIENRVVPSMRGAQYIGFDFDSASQVYTLKFLRNGTVIWVSVDGRSGAILGRTDR